MNNEMDRVVGRELTEQELMMIQGGSIFSAIGSVFSTVGNAVFGGISAGVGALLPAVGHFFSAVGRAHAMGFRVLLRA